MPDQYEVWLWSFPGLLLGHVFLLMVVAAMVAEWHLSLLGSPLVLLGWFMLRERTTSNADGIVCHGWPWPWQARRFSWDEIEEIAIGQSDLRLVPADGGYPLPVPGTKEMTLRRRKREAKLANTRAGLLQWRTEGVDR